MPRVEAEKESAAPPPDLTRIAVVGTSCTGKSTLAAQLARDLDQPLIELDEIHWGPGWSTDPEAVFRDKVRAAVEAPNWVCAGNYSVVSDLVLARATALVWLDLSFPLTFFRALRRTARRTLLREPVCGDNYERWSGFLDPDWIPYWVVRTWRRNRTMYRGVIDSGEFAPLDVVVLQSRQDIDRFAATRSLARPSSDPAR